MHTAILCLHGGTAETIPMYIVIFGVHQGIAWSIPCTMCFCELHGGIARMTFIPNVVFQIGMWVLHDWVIYIV
jgi:hypothetical protein